MSEYAYGQLRMNIARPLPKMWRVISSSAVVTRGGEHKRKRLHRRRIRNRHTAIASDDVAAVAPDVLERDAHQSLILPSLPYKTVQLRVVLSF
jgi:hypothetical protein